MLITSSSIQPFNRNFSNEGVSMNPKLIAVPAAILLLALSGTAHAQATLPNWSADPATAQQPAPSAAPVANSAPITDQSSYGGTPMSTGRSGGRIGGTPCVVGLSCDIYQGS
jgi:hypothetical protein